MPLSRHAAPRPAQPPPWYQPPFASRTKGLRVLGPLLRPGAMDPSAEEKAGSLGKGHNPDT